jgi:signal transduction histidine kinase
MPSSFTNRLSLPTKGIILICLPLICELVFVITLTNLVHQAEKDATAANSSAQMIQRGHRLIELAFASASGCQGYAITGNPLYKELYKQATRDYPPLLKEFNDSTQSTPEQENAQKQIEIISNKYLGILAHDMSSGGLAEEENSLAAEELSILQNRIEDFLGEEEDIQQQRYLVQVQARQRLNRFIFIAVGCNILLALALSLFFSYSITRRLRVVIANTKKLSEGKELTPPLGGNDEIAELDKVFHEMATSLKEVERLKREFVAMVTHDLRVPLTSIQLFLDALTEGLFGPLSEKMQTHAKSAKRSAEHMVNLIQDLLDISQLESGAFKLQRRPVKVDQLIDESIERISPLAEEKNVQVLKKGIDDTEILADGDRIKQVLINLLSNAIKFSAADTTVKVTCYNLNDNVKFAVEDKGQGIAEDMQSQIFDRFQRAVYDTKAAGSGLGLAICKSLVEKHGGTIGVHSQVGKGSTFWFTIPKAGLTD